MGKQEFKRLKSTTERLRFLGESYGDLIGILLILIVFNMFNPMFLRLANIWNVFKASTFLILMAMGMTLVMSVRGIDLSIAQVADASGVIAAYLILHNVNAIAAVVIALFFGFLVGTINAALMAYLGVPALIGTLGMMYIVRSFELVLTNGSQPQILFTLPRNITIAFLNLGQGQIGAIPVSLFIGIAFMILVFLLKEKSITGRHMDAIMVNVRASFLSGINVRKTFGIAFLCSSFLAALAGLLISARAGGATPRAVESYLNDCFVAVYIGTLLSKSRKFNVLGTIIGCLFVSFLSNFFTLMSLSNGIKNLFNGAFIIMAVALGTIKDIKNK